MAAHDPIAPEVWKSIARIPGYEVSDRGRVRSYWKKAWDGRRGSVRRRIARPKIVRPRRHAQGYLLITAIDVCGVRRSHRVHQLVLETFVGPCPEGLECCHEDGCPAHNWVGNLYWGTHSQNCLDAVRHGRHYPSKPALAVIQEMLALRTSGATYAEIARQRGLHEGTVGRLFREYGLRRCRGRCSQGEIDQIVALRQEGISFQGIADRLGITRSTVQVMFRRAEQTTVGDGSMIETSPNL
jgi:DNA-binding CsgD family transcriptional regulator